VLVLAQARDDLGDLERTSRSRPPSPADDQRRARLVDEDGVDLVHDRVVQLALHVVVMENFMLSRM
jgi:hypothetical protein